MSPEQLKHEWPKIEKRLRVGDIILIHSRRGFIKQIIQRRSNSYWNHTALVIADHTRLPFGSPLIVEANETGIEIRTLKRYTSNFKLNDIGVMRRKGLSKKEREELVRSFILNNIDVPYDYARLVGIFFGTFIRPFSPELSDKLIARTVHFNAFLCSTFVYNAFYSRTAKRQNHFQNEKERIEYIRKREMHKPGDLAKSRKFSWIFNKRP